MKLLGLMLMCPTFCFAFNPAKDVPPQSKPYLPVVTKQMREVIPGFHKPEYFGALIEHESGCPSIPDMCWNPKARLKSAREEGAGLGQITRTFNPDGSIRFDILKEMRSLDPRGLNELRWDTVYDRPDLQIRAMLLLSRQNWARVKQLTSDTDFQIYLTDLAYNAGFGRVLNDRRACALQRGCDPQKWHSHVEKTCTASTKPLYGTRSACDISRHHVHDVVDVRMSKYKGKV